MVTTKLECYRPTEETYVSGAPSGFADRLVIHMVTARLACRTAREERHSPSGDSRGSTEVSPALEPKHVTLGATCDHIGGDALNATI